MSIAENRRAHFDYHIEERHEAGMVLHGWEIKAIRAGAVKAINQYTSQRTDQKGWKKAGDQQTTGG